MARNLGLPVLAGIRKPLRPDTLRDAIEGLDREQGIARPARVSLPDSALCASALADAIAADAIAVHYQPKVDMQRGIVCGVEALARWTHPELGEVRPDQFVALAEREGLIRELTAIVMRRALAQAGRWRQQGLDLSMAINLSPRVLEDPQLVTQLVRLLALNELEARQVVLEITESSVVDCMGVALGVLARLRLKGFGLSIDDYGTGFSSMQQLARIPFSELKIDRSFVHGASKRTNLRVILQSALNMARQLGLVTVAEGIETIEDWQLVRDSGCGVGQGFLISPALLADDVPGWIRAHEARVRSLGAA
jgi:EAL domain-containing protein (putative c-di-GMP-specific phosphodiesterase class I)